MDMLISEQTLSLASGRFTAKEWNEGTLDGILNWLSTLLKTDGSVELRLGDNENELVLAFFSGAGVEKYVMTMECNAEDFLEMKAALQEAVADFSRDLEEVKTRVR